MDQVKGWWESYQFFATPSFILAHKLEGFKVGFEEMERGGVWECWVAEKLFTNGT